MCFFSPPLPPSRRLLRLRRHVVPDDDEPSRERPRVRVPGAELQRREWRRRPRGGGLARGLNEKKKKKTTDERKPHQLFLSNLDPLFFLPSKNSFRPRCVPPRLVPFLVLFLLFSVVWKEREKEREGERERGTGWGKEKRKNFSSSSHFFGSLFSSPTLFALYPPWP